MPRARQRAISSSRAAGAPYREWAASGFAPKYELAHEVTPIECLVPEAGVITMRLGHASSNSLSATPRTVLPVEYAASASIADPLELAVA